MAHAISTWDIPSLPIRDSKDLFPVRRIFCVGRNYVEHQKEMGGDGRETPFWFIKSAHALVPGGGSCTTRPRRELPLRNGWWWRSARAPAHRREEGERAVFGYGVDWT